MSGLANALRLFGAAGRIAAALPVAKKPSTETSMFALLPTLISLLTSSQVVKVVEGAATLAADLSKLGGAGGVLIADVEALFSKHRVGATAAGGTIAFHNFKPVEPGAPGPGSPEGPGAVASA